MKTFVIRKCKHFCVIHNFERVFKVSLDEVSFDCSICRGRDDLGCQTCKDREKK